MIGTYIGPLKFGGNKVEILYEDKEVIVCVKPVGMPVQSDRSRAKDMLNTLRNYVVESPKGYMLDKGIPFIGLVHRLDRPVGGVMVFAKTPDSLRILNKEVTEKKLGKHYLAITSSNTEKIYEEYRLEDGKALTDWIHVEDYLIKDGKLNVSKVVDNSNKQAKKAILDYRIIDRRRVNDKIYSMLEVKLETGRHHQIRVQMANQGLPLEGDAKYNKNIVDTDNESIALFSYKLEFVHPKTKQKMEYCKMPENGYFKYFDNVTMD